MIPVAETAQICRWERGLDARLGLARLGKRKKEKRKKDKKKG